MRRSFDVAAYEPAAGTEWDEAYSRFLVMREQIGQRGFASSKMPNIPSRAERNTDTND